MNDPESIPQVISRGKIAKVDTKNPNEGLMGVYETLPPWWNLLSALPDLPMARLLHFLVVPASSSTGLYNFVLFLFCLSFRPFGNKPLGVCKCW